MILCGLGGGTIPWKFFNFYSHLKTGKFKFLYKNEHLFFLKTGNFTIIWVPYKHTVPERLSSQSEKIWNKGDFTNPNSQLFNKLGKNLEIEPRPISENPVYNLFTEMGKIEKPVNNNIQKSQNLIMHWKKLETTA